MAKTELTKHAEHCLWRHTNKMGVFGCFEVTIGWFGKEIVDYITYDTNVEIRCYEIKVSKSDFLSKANKTFIGHFNYFIMPRELYQQLIDENNSSLNSWLFSGIGIYVFDERCLMLECVRKAKRKVVTHGQTSEVLESMLRSTNREMKKFYLKNPYWE